MKAITVMLVALFTFSFIASTATAFYDPPAMQPQVVQVLIVDDTTGSIYGTRGFSYTTGNNITVWNITVVLNCKVSSESYDHIGENVYTIYEGNLSLVPGSPRNFTILVNTEGLTWINGEISIWYSQGDRDAIKDKVTLSMLVDYGMHGGGGYPIPPLFLIFIGPFLFFGAQAGYYIIERPRWRNISRSHDDARYGDVLGWWMFSWADKGRLWAVVLIWAIVAVLITLAILAFEVFFFSSFS